MSGGRTCSTRRRGLVSVTASVVLLLGLANCGYNFPGEGRTLPGGATSIYIAKFDNHTRDAGLENFLLESLQAEIARRGQFTLVKDRAGAQLALEGSIISLETRPQAFTTSDEAVQYQTFITISAALKNTQNGKVVWRISSLRESDSYGAVANTVVTDSPQFVSGSLNPNDLSQLSDVQLSESQQGEALDRCCRTPRATSTTPWWKTSEHRCAGRGAATRRACECGAGWRQARRRQWRRGADQQREIRNDLDHRGRMQLAQGIPPRRLCPLRSLVPAAAAPSCQLRCRTVRAAGYGG